MVFEVIGPIEGLDWPLWKKGHLAISGLKVVRDVLHHLIKRHLLLDNCCPLKTSVFAFLASKFLTLGTARSGIRDLAFST